VRLAEAWRLTEQLSDQLWPGWSRTALGVLLVTDSAEFLVGHPRPTADFARVGYDSLLKRQVWTRPRQFPPTLLATFPAVGGVPTIVIGSAERTGKSSTTWVLTVLHEHFHQWQYSQPSYYAGVARLDLAHGDSTGQWMLNYPFPYDSAPTAQTMRRLASSLRRTLDGRTAAGTTALKNVTDARNLLQSRLPEADYRYFEFQLWQEGVARYIEYAAARAAAKLQEPSAAFKSLPDYVPYSQAADSARHAFQRELEQFDLVRQRRVAFYPLGAAMALLLETTRPDWKQVYTASPFTLAALLSGNQ
jgi:hypothetical protein